MIPGEEIFFKSISNQFKSPQDVIVASIHFFLIHQGFKCVGSGPEFTARVDRLKGSELLPNDWNKDSGQSFVLHYIIERENSYQTLLFRYDNINGHWFANFLLNPGENSFDIEVKPEDYITNDYQIYERAFVEDDSSSKLFKLMEKEVLPKLKKDDKKKDQSNEKRSGEGSSNPSSLPDPGAGPSTEVRGPPIPSFPSIGGADLDPFGSGIGGGMIFDPRDPRHFSSPANPLARSRFQRPPGARFDPFGPPSPEGLGRFRGPRPRGPEQGYPDPDHMRPPDYDDMFM